MKFIFEHEKREDKFHISKQPMLFCLFYKPTNNEVFEDFPKISTIFGRFLKIFKMFSEGHTNIYEHFSNFSENLRRLPKISRVRSDDFSTKYR